MNLREFIDECRKRTIFRTISIYAVSAWLIIQIAATTFPFLGLPEIAVTFVIICVLFGLPIMMGFSWYYSIRSEEEGSLTFRQDEDNPNLEKNRIFQKIYFSITAIVFIGVIVIVGLLVDQNESNPTSDLAQQEAVKEEEGRIIVEEFENKTGDASLDIIGEMAADRIEHSITQNKLATVVSNDAFLDYDEILEMGNSSSVSVYEYLSIQTKIIGNYYLDGDTLLFDCSVVDAKSGEVKDALQTIRTPRTNPLDAIDRIKDIVLGYVATKSSAPQLFIESHTPKFEAYKYFLLRNEDPDNQLWYVEKAIEIDPDYFEPKLIRLSYLYNDGKYQQVDSMYQILKKESIQADDRQKNLLSFYSALLEGNNRMVYNYHLNEYKLAPFHLPSNSTMMVLALQYVNRPIEVIEFYKDVPSSELDVPSCNVCNTRSYVYGMALFQLARYQDAARHFEELTEVSNRLPYVSFLAKSYVRLRDWDKLDKLIYGWRNANQEGLPSIFSVIGKECLLVSENNKAGIYFSKALDEMDAEERSIEKAEVLYHLERYEDAYGVFAALLEEEKDSGDLYFWLAICSFQKADEAKANKYIELLEDLRGAYDFGEMDYKLAKYYAGAGDATESISYLRSSVAKGMTFQSSLFLNDPFFRKINTTPAFTDIMNYWR